MKCPFCSSSDGEVLESRVIEDGSAIRRRRACSKCHKRYTTFERVKESNLWVVKRDGRREMFDREKIRRGVQRALEKRPVSQETIDALVRSIEQEMMRKNTQEISADIIGRAVLRRLGRLDKVAWIRFASVYFKFTDLLDFEKYIAQTLKKE